jgi:hypothetical protein
MLLDEQFLAVVSVYDFSQRRGFDGSQSPLFG